MKAVKKNKKEKKNSKTQIEWRAEQKSCVRVRVCMKREWRSIPGKYM